MDRIFLQGYIALLAAGRAVEQARGGSSEK
jgi:hypothetical protein